jgi:hypothetical protein
MTNYDLWKSDVGPWPSVGDFGDGPPAERSSWFRPLFPPAPWESVCDLTTTPAPEPMGDVLDLTGDPGTGSPQPRRQNRQNPAAAGSTAEGDVVDLTESEAVVFDRDIRTALVTVHHSLTAAEQERLAAEAVTGDRLAQRLVAVLREED